jgi:hypothetical protein
MNATPLNLLYHNNNHVSFEPASARALDAATTPTTPENSDAEPENDAEDEVTEDNDGTGVNYDIPPPPVDLL